MSLDAENTKLECLSGEIAAYIDGELDPFCEAEVEAHIDGCDDCSERLNQQKQFLCAINSGLKAEPQIELPDNFTRLIVANAESTVSGLRRPRERFNALFICAGLLLFVLFALGSATGSFVDGVFTIIDQTTAVLGFFGHVFYSVLIGLAIIVRSVASQFRLDVAAGVIVTALFAAFLMLLSRRMVRIRRA
jgi:hypothetical protein